MNAAYTDAKNVFPAASGTRRPEIEGLDPVTAKNLTMFQAAEFKGEWPSMGWFEAKVAARAQTDGILDKSARMGFPVPTWRH